MESFLKQLAQTLKKDYRNDISNICIVLPNRRAGTFLRQHISQVYDGVIWSPDIYSTEDFIAELTDRHILDPVSIIFEFYQCYLQVEKDNAQPFEDFVKWAQVLVHDFGEIDAYLADGDKLFKFLNEAHAMEVWNPEDGNITDFQSNYLGFWKSLGKYYKVFRNHLDEKNYAYKELAFRTAAENIEQIFTKGSAYSNKWSKVIFAGFNAMTTAEEKIIKHLSDLRKGDIFWDMDSYYLDNDAQEAGKFLRKFRQKWGGNSFNNVINSLATEQKNIKIIGVPGSVGQAKAAGDILTSVERKDHEKTALVLADESLMMPVLQSLPETIEHVNITMGYPLKNTPLHSFWSTVFLLHEKSNSFNRSKTGNQFYHKDILKVINHSFVHLIPDLSAIAQSLASRIKKHNRIFLTGDDLVEFLDEKELEKFKPLLHLFNNWENNPQIALESFKKLSHLFRDHLLESEEGSSVMALEIEQLCLYDKVINRIGSLISEYRSVKEIRTLRKIFNQVAGSQTIPFYGEPLKGLQIMGMLETRTLDFDTVILLSANEGVLPAGKSENSLIPYDIKRNFGLPTHVEKDAIFAYHFYRLLQRAKNVYLLYNSIQGDFGGGEKSRYILQLLNELPKINEKISIEEKLLTFPVKPRPPIKTTVSKNSNILEKLDGKLASGLSPSAINTFINCPLDFYYKYIARIREPEEVEERIEANTFGKFIHEVLEKFYQPYLHKILLPDDVKKMLPQVEDKTRSVFLTEYKPNELSYGKNLLSLKVAVRFIRTFLENEIRMLRELGKKGQNLTIVALEKKMFAQVNLKGKKIRLEGTADRIDRIGNTIRVVDYKTGAVQERELKLDEVEGISADPNCGKAFQLLMYGYLYSKTSDMNGSQLVSGNISFRSLSKGLMPVSVNNNSVLDPTVLDQFEEELSLLLDRMYDISDPFVHSEEAKYCKVCIG